jgi:hypothetical protein
MCDLGCGTLRSHSRRAAHEKNQLAAKCDGQLIG